MTGEVTEGAPPGAMAGTLREQIHAIADQAALLRCALGGLEAQAETSCIDQEDIALLHDMSARMRDSLYKLAEEVV